MLASEEGFCSTELLYGPSTALGTCGDAWYWPTTTLLAQRCWQCTVHSYLKNSFKTQYVLNSLLPSHIARTLMFNIPTDSYWTHSLSISKSTLPKTLTAIFSPRLSHSFGAAAVNLLTAASIRYAYSTACFCCFKFNAFL
jgi:hypothetical protein